MTVLRGHSGRIGGQRSVAWSEDAYLAPAQSDGTDEVMLNVGAHRLLPLFQPESHYSLRLLIALRRTMSRCLQSATG